MEETSKHRRKVVARTHLRKNTHESHREQLAKRVTGGTVSRVGFQNSGQASKQEASKQKEANCGA